MTSFCGDNGFIQASELQHSQRNTINLENNNHDTIVSDMAINWLSKSYR